MLWLSIKIIQVVNWNIEIFSINDLAKVFLHYLYLFKERVDFFDRGRCFKDLFKLGRGFGDSLETNQANRTTWTLPHTLGVPSVDPSLPKQCLLTFVFNQIVCLKLKYLCPLSISTKYWTDQIIRICCSIGFRQLLTHGIIICFISVTADYYNPDWRYLINWFVKWSFI